MIGSNGLILVTLGSVFLLLMFVLLWAVLLLLGAIQQNRLFAEEGVVTTGSVTQRQVRRFKGRPQYYVTYEFTAESPVGRVVHMQAQEQVWPFTYDRLPEGTRVFVEYVPGKPEVSRLSPVQQVVPQAA